MTYERVLMELVSPPAILDAFSQKVVGYAIRESLDAELAATASKSVIERPKPRLGCIHHWDCGVDYACDQYVSCIRKQGLRVSMSTKGNP
jgi:putative transposase